MIKVKDAILNKDAYTILLDVRSHLSNGKLAVVEKSGVNDIKISCPFHKNGLEKKPSCFVRMDDAVYHCFTCNESGSFSKLIAACFEMTIPMAEKWLLTNYTDGYTITKTTPKLESINLTKKKDIYLDESILNTFESYHPYMKKRKLTDKVISDFEVKYDPKTKSIVFPVRDKYNHLIALTKRSVENKAFYIETGFDKSNLYGINKLDYSKPVYLVESQINALTLFGYGDQALATFGAGCPDKQIEALNSLPVRHFIIAFDNDPAGLKGAKKLCKELSKFKFVDVVKFNDSRDVNDLTKDEFYALKREDRFTFLKS